MAAAEYQAPFPTSAVGDRTSLRYYERIATYAIGKSIARRRLCKRYQQPKIAPGLCRGWGLFSAICFKKIRDPG